MGDVSDRQVDRIAAKLLIEGARYHAEVFDGEDVQDAMAELEVGVDLESLPDDEAEKLCERIGKRMKDATVKVTFPDSDVMRRNIGKQTEVDHG